MKSLTGYAYNLMQVQSPESKDWELHSELILMLHEKKYEIVEGKPVGISIIESQRIVATKEMIMELAIYLTKIVEEMEKFERVDQQQNDKHQKSKKGV